MFPPNLSKLGTESHPTSPTGRTPGQGVSPASYRSAWRGHRPGQALREHSGSQPHTASPRGLRLHISHRSFGNHRQGGTVRIGTHTLGHNIGYGSDMSYRAVLTRTRLGSVVGLSGPTVSLPVIHAVVVDGVGQRHGLVKQQPIGAHLC